jgi:hypothetical protein
VKSYADQTAVTKHFKGCAVQNLVPQLVQFCTPKRMEFYGEPGAEVTAMAKHFGAEIFTAWEGFDR